MEAVRSVLAEVGAGRVPTVDVFNKCDKLEAAELARVRTLNPGSLCVSALTGSGRDEVIAAMETRLGLDTARVTMTFPLAGDDARERVTELYRLGRILSHVANEDSVVIDAEIPRRLLPRFQSAKGQA